MVFPVQFSIFISIYIIAIKIFSLLFFVQSKINLNSMTMKQIFLKQKFKTIFQNYPYVYVIQHNILVSNTWKKIKQELHKLPSHSLNEENSRTFDSSELGQPSRSLHIIPNRILKTLFHLDISNSDQDFQDVFQNSVGPCCFLGCYSPHDLTLFYDILKKMKLHPYSLFHVGLFLKKNRNYTFCNSLQIENLLSITTNEEFTSKVLYSSKFYEVLKPGFNIQRNLLQNLSFLGLDSLASLHRNQLTLIQALDFKAS